MLWCRKENVFSRSPYCTGFVGQWVNVKCKLKIQLQSASFQDYDGPNNLSGLINHYIITN